MTAKYSCSRSQIIRTYDFVVVGCILTKGGCSNQARVIIYQTLRYEVFKIFLTGQLLDKNFQTNIKACNKKN